MLAYFSQNHEKPSNYWRSNYSQNIFNEMNQSSKTIMDKTGYSNLRLKIKELNADLVAEVSGHIFFNDRYYGFDDAIYATFRVIELLYLGINLDKELDKLPKFTSSNIEIDVNENNKFFNRRRNRKQTNKI